MNGQKLRGEYKLIKMRNDDPKAWLLMKVGQARSVAADPQEGAGPGRRPRRHLVQPDQDLLAGRRLHQGRPDRLLRRAWPPPCLPHLKDRPLSLNRHPDGIDGANFFQKNIDPAAAAGVGPARRPSFRARAARTSAICSARTRPRCSTSPTWAASRSIPGYRGWNRSTIPTTWPSISIRRTSPSTRWSRRPWRSAAARSHRRPLLLQDVRQERPAHLCAAGRPLPLRQGQAVRRAGGHDHLPSAAEDHQRAAQARPSGSSASTSITCRIAAARRWRLCTRCGPSRAPGYRRR